MVPTSLRPRGFRPALSPARARGRLPGVVLALLIVSGTVASAPGALAAGAPTTLSALGRIRGWAGISRDTPLAFARLTILDASGRDITLRTTGLRPVACGTAARGTRYALCTMANGAILLPVARRWPTGARIRASSGRISGAAVRGGLEAVLRRASSFTSVTLATTMRDRLVRSGVGKAAAARRATDRLGLLPSTQVGFHERYLSGVLDRPERLALIRRLGLDAFVMRALTGRGHGAAWRGATAASSATTPALSGTNLRAAREPDGMALAQVNIAGGAINGIVGMLSQKGFLAVLTALGVIPTQPSLTQISNQLTTLQSSVNGLQASVDGLVDTVNGDFALMQSDFQVNTCNQETISGLLGNTDVIDSQWYDELSTSWQALDNLVTYPGATSSTGSAQFIALTQDYWATMAGWNVGAPIDGAAQELWTNATSGAASIANAWATDVTCLKGGRLLTSSGNATATALASWVYESNLIAAATLTASYRGWLAVCGSNPTVTGTCPTAPTTAISTSDLTGAGWSSIYSPYCAGSVGGPFTNCYALNYYAMIGGARLSTPPACAGVDIKTGNLWAAANVDLTTSRFPSGSGLLGDPSLDAEVAATNPAASCAGAGSTSVLAAGPIPTSGWTIPVPAEASDLVTPGTVALQGAGVGSYGYGPGSALPGDWLNTQLASIPSATSRKTAACAGFGPALSTSTYNSYSQAMIDNANAGGPMVGFDAARGCTANYGILEQFSYMDYACGMTLGYQTPWNVNWVAGTGSQMGVNSGAPSGACTGWSYDGSWTGSCYMCGTYVHGWQMAPSALGGTGLATWGVQPLDGTVPSASGVGVLLPGNLNCVPPNGTANVNYNGTSVAGGGYAPCMQIPGLATLAILPASAYDTSVNYVYTYGMEQDVTNASDCPALTDPAPCSLTATLPATTALTVSP